MFRKDVLLKRTNKKKKTVYGCSISPLTQNNFLKYLPDLKSNKKWLSSVLYFFSFPPASEARRKVANLIGRKNSHTSVYGVKEFVRLSVCLSVVIFDPNYLRTGWTEWAKKNLGHLWQKCMFLNFVYLIFRLTRTKKHLKKLAPLAARAVFVSSFLLQNFKRYGIKNCTKSAKAARRLETDNKTDTER